MIPTSRAEPAVRRQSGALRPTTRRVQRRAKPSKCRCVRLICIHNVEAHLKHDRQEEQRWMAGRKKMRALRD